MFSKFLFTLATVCVLSFIAGYLPTAIAREAEFNRRHLERQLSAMDRADVLAREGR